jgi:hypothetical protein
MINQERFFRNEYLAAENRILGAHLRCRKAAPGERYADEMELNDYVLNTHVFAKEGLRTSEANFGMCRPERLREPGGALADASAANIGFSVK